MAKFLDTKGVETMWSTIKKTFVKQEAGKQLSSNDFTNDYKTILDMIDPDKLEVNLDIYEVSDDDIDDIMTGGAE